MRATTPTLHCDGDGGECGAWDVDYYDSTASTVNGILITKTVRAPGWDCNDRHDHCPEHANTKAGA